MAFIISIPRVYSSGYYGTAVPVVSGGSRPRVGRWLTGSTAIITGIPWQQSWRESRLDQKWFLHGATVLDVSAVLKEALCDWTYVQEKNQLNAVSNPCSSLRSTDVRGTFRIDKLFFPQKLLAASQRTRPRLITKLWHGHPVRQQACVLYEFTMRRGTHASGARAVCGLGLLVQCGRASSCRAGPAGADSKTCFVLAPAMRWCGCGCRFKRRRRRPASRTCRPRCSPRARTACWSR